MRSIKLTSTIWHSFIYSFPQLDTKTKLQDVSRCRSCTYIHTLLFNSPHIVRPYNSLVPLPCQIYTLHVKVQASGLWIIRVLESRGTSWIRQCVCHTRPGYKDTKVEKKKEQNIANGRKREKERENDISVGVNWERTSEWNTSGEEKSYKWKAL